ncbi:MAG TPA: hypothetical protein VMA36_20805 [Candidatus Limnocylindria bacterium]|nr:hypothetical protein [Candidatus Limnocylindria bacterium]
MKESPPRTRLRIDPSDLVLEIISIVIAILLALGVNEWRDALRARANAHEAMVAIRDEIVANDRELHALMPHHLANLQAFRALLKGSSRQRPVSFDTFMETFGRVNPHGFQAVQAESTAWDLARGSGVLSAVPYATRVALERAYREQSFLNTYPDRIIADLHFGVAPRNADFRFAANGFWIDTADAVLTEQRLAQDYAAARKALDAALR